MDYLFDPEELGEGARFIPESGLVEVSFSFTPEQKALFDQVGERLQADLGRPVTPEEVMLHICKYQVAKPGLEKVSLN